MKETELGGKRRQRMTKIGTVKGERERLREMDYNEKKKK